jgi:hypothetical protein
MSTETVLIDNEHVRVTKVVMETGDTVGAPSRHKRVVVALDYGEKLHNGEDVVRLPGEAVWREASDGHTVENKGGAHAVLIIEVKS